jgi:acetoin utilization deacetylase AcuC-like enzyme
LISAHGLERVAIVDWDVHHGNGTQHIFERDPRVFYASLHQWPLYPGTGLASERGLGAGAGTTLNLPQDRARATRSGSPLSRTKLLPALARYRPQFVIVSAGFDAHARDPLSQTELSTQAYTRMSASLFAARARDVRRTLVSLLEGGYDLQALADCVEAHASELLRA